MMVTWTTKNGVEISRILARRCNCYVVRHRGRFLLVDTSRRTERKNLAQALESLGITRLSLLVLTHCHFDHTENAAYVRQRFKASIAVHTSEAPLLEAGENAAICGTVWPTRLLIRAVTARHIHRFFRYCPTGADIRVQGRFDLGALGFPGYILHTPGHTGGSVSLIVDNEIAMVGDAMFGVFKNGVLTPFGADSDQMVRTWKTLLDTDCRLFLPAHGKARPRDVVEQAWLRRRQDSSPLTGF
jgi:glyoxylase-like metal-dependent hydrolase (beta-lactamase superfamily II)